MEKKKEEDIWEAAGRITNCHWSKGTLSYLADVLEVACIEREIITRDLQQELIAFLCRKYIEVFEKVNNKPEGE